RSLAATSPGVKLLIVEVGKVMPPDRPTPEAERLGQTVFRAFQRGRRRMIYGWTGLALVVLFHLQPLAFSLAVKLRRLAVQSSKDR
ncbi:MAG: hypothetical protein AAB654_14090, partial [Acidobacteriota bacterium]